MAAFVLWFSSQALLAPHMARAPTPSGRVALRPTVVMADEQLPQISKDDPDPLQKPRPKYGLAPVSGRPSEKVFGADMPTAEGLVEWADHMRKVGISRVLLLSADDPAPDVLSGPGGFAVEDVAVIDPRAAGAAQQTAAAVQGAVSAGVRIGVCGESSALVLAQWLLSDYIGGDNCMEACDLLRHRKRHSGVDWTLDPADLQRFLGFESGGRSSAEPPPPPPSPPSDSPRVSPGGILLG